jgi:hypothetical protein
MNEPEPIDISIDPTSVPEDEWPQCPLCGGDWIDDARDAPTWEPGVYEGTDVITTLSVIDTGTLMVVRRRWRITVEVEHLSALPPRD